MYKEQCAICGIIKEYSSWPMCGQEARVHGIKLVKQMPLLQEHIWVNMLQHKFYGKSIPDLYEDFRPPMSWDEDRWV
jgi:hypothetical protein